MDSAFYSWARNLFVRIARLLAPTKAIRHREMLLKGGTQQPNVPWELVEELSLRIVDLGWSNHSGSRHEPHLVVGRNLCDKLGLLSHGALKDDKIKRLFYRHYATPETVDLITKTVNSAIAARADDENQEQHGPPWLRINLQDYYDTSEKPWRFRAEFQVAKNVSSLYISLQCKILIALIAVALAGSASYALGEAGHHMIDRYFLRFDQTTSVVTLIWFGLHCKRVAWKTSASIAYIAGTIWILLNCCVIGPKWGIELAAWLNKPDLLQDKLACAVASSTHTLFTVAAFFPFYFYFHRVTWSFFVWPILNRFVDSHLSSGSVQGASTCHCQRFARANTSSDSRTQVRLSLGTQRTPWFANCASCSIWRQFHSSIRLISGLALELVRHPRTFAPASSPDARLLLELMTV
jgi:hypothetical protein